MKKNVFVWLLGFFAAITICLKSETSVRAFAATNYYLEVSVLSTSEAAAIDPSGTVHGGDYKISFCVDVDPNAMKPNGFSLYYEYNSNKFNPIHKNNLPYSAFYVLNSSQSDLSGAFISAGISENNQRFSFLVASPDNPIDFNSGEIASMFIRPKPEALPLPANTAFVENFHMAQISTEINGYSVDMPQTEYTPNTGTSVNISYHDIHFIVGDLSGNGSINSNDHVYYLAILQNNSSYTENNISVLTSSDAPGLFVSDAIIGNQIIFEAGDVNSDGVINQQDANLIVQYCQDDLLGILTGNEYIGSEWIARFKLTATNGTITNIELDCIVPAE